MIHTSFAGIRDEAQSQIDLASATYFKGASQVRKYSLRLLRKKRRENSMFAPSIWDGNCG